MSCHSDDHNKKGDMLRYYIDQIEQHDEQHIKEKIVRDLDKERYPEGKRVSFVGADRELQMLPLVGARGNGKTAAIYAWGQDMYAVNIALKKELAQVKKERDAAVADLKDAEVARCDCLYCRHIKDLDDSCEADCDACTLECKCKGCIDNALWEWRGVRED